VSAQLALSHPFSLPGAASPPVNMATPPCLVTLPSHGVKTSSLPPLHLPIIFHHVVSPLKLKTEALNPHHRRWPPSLDSPTPTLHGQPDSHHHCYKKVISIFVTLPITQSRLYFASSLARASCHRSFTHRHCFLSPSFHVHHPSAQQHL
jgi:hypothetical protein